MVDAAGGDGAFHRGVDAGEHGCEARVDGGLNRLDGALDLCGRRSLIHFREEVKLGVGERGRVEIADIRGEVREGLDRLDGDGGDLLDALGHFRVSLFSQRASLLTNSQ